MTNLAMWCWANMEYAVPIKKDSIKNYFSAGHKLYTSPNVETRMKPG